MTLDANGWAGIDKLIEGARKVGFPLSHELIYRVVQSNGKQRFVISSDGLRIRASQGHSKPIDLTLPESVPPEILFHGTTKRFLSAIMREGIKPGRRIHVHLSGDKETAARVGSRHGPPVALHVYAGKMQRQGYHFFLSENGVWLTDWVPVEFIDNTCF